MSAYDKLKAAGLAARVGGHVLREKLGPAIRPLDPDVVPSAAEGIMPGWLTAHLCRTVPGAAVEEVEVLGGSDGTSSRRALRIAYNAAGKRAGLPEFLFSKSATSFFSRLLLGVTGIVEGESLFYNRVRPGLAVRSPMSYYAGFDPRAYRSLVLLDDLAAAGWSFPDPLHNPVSRADAEDMVCELAAYHGALWESPRFDDDLRPLRGAHEWQVGLNGTVSFEKRTLTGLKRAQDIVPPELVSRAAELYPKFMRSLALHDNSPRTLLHQDVHLGNWLRDPDGRMGLYDWQCVATGHWALDYSYALACCLDTDDRRSWEKDLLTLYLDRLRAAGVSEPPSFHEAWLAYRQQPLHALVFGLFTLGGSALEPELQPRDYTRFAIKRIAQHVADLETLDAIEI